MEDTSLETATQTPPAPQTAPSGILGCVIRLRLAKDAAGAQKVLLIVIAVCILIMIVLWWSSIGTPIRVPLPPTRTS